MCKIYMKQNNTHTTGKYSVEYKISMCLITHAFADTCNIHTVSTLTHSRNYHNEFINALHIYDSYEGNTVYSQVSTHRIS